MGLVVSEVPDASPAGVRFVGTNRMLSKRDRANVRFKEQHQSPRTTRMGRRRRCYIGPKQLVCFGVSDGEKQTFVDHRGRPPLSTLCGHRVIAAAVRLFDSAAIRALWPGGIHHRRLFNDSTMLVWTSTLVSPTTPAMSDSSRIGV